MEIKNNSPYIAVIVFLVTAFILIYYNFRKKEISIQQEQVRIQQQQYNLQQQLYDEKQQKQQDLNGCLEKNKALFRDVLSKGAQSGVPATEERITNIANAFKQGEQDCYTNYPQ